MCSSDLYLQKGVILEPDSNINEKKLLTETSPEFVEWVQNQEFVSGQKYGSSEIYDRFILHTGLTTDNKTFIGYLRSYAQTRGWGLLQPHSGNTRYVEFIQR